MGRKTGASLWAFGLVAGALTLLAGCGTSKPVARRAPGVFVGNQGGASEAVFPGPEVEARLADGGGWEAGRNNSLMADAGERDAAHGLAWHEGPRPSLRHPRYITIPRDPSTQIWFPERGGWYGHRRWWY